MAAKSGTIHDFVQGHSKWEWYLGLRDGSGVLPGTVPVDPVCLKKDKSWSKHLHFDLSLSDHVVEDEAHGDLMRKLQSHRHCSLVSASGAGKTKAVLDLLKVRGVTGVPRDVPVAVRCYRSETLPSPVMPHASSLHN